MTDKRFKVTNISSNGMTGLFRLGNDTLPVFDVVRLLNELHEENHFLKEKEKDMLNYLKKEYDYVYNQKKKHFDDAILVTGYELIEYHIKSMIEHLEGL